MTTTSGVDATAVFTAVANFKSLDAAIDTSMAKLAQMQKLVKTASVTSSGAVNTQAQIVGNSPAAVGSLAASLGSDLPAAAARSKAAALDAGAGIETLGARAKHTVLELDNLNHSGEQLWRNMAYGRLAAGGLAVAFATIGFAVGKMSIDYNKMIETQATAFASILKSQTAANELVKQVQGVAGVSPFTFEQLAAPIQKLLTSGFNQAQLLQGQGAQAKGLIVDIGNAAAAQGPRAVQSLNAITQALARMESTGKVSQRVITELATAGVDVGPAIQASLKLTNKQMQNIATSGVTVNQVIGAVSESLRTKFSGSMQTASETFAARVKNIKEDLSIGISNAFHGAFSDAEIASTGFVSRLEHLMADVDKMGFMPALRQDLPIVGKGADALISAFTRIKDTVAALSPEIKAFVTVLAGAAFGGVVLALESIATSLELIDKVLMAIPGPAKEAIGAFLGIYVLLRLINESQTIANLIERVIKLKNVLTGADSWFSPLQAQPVSPGGAEKFLTPAAAQQTAVNNELAAAKERVARATADEKLQAATLAEAQKSEMFTTQELAAQVVVLRTAHGEAAAAANAQAVAEERLALVNKNVSDKSNVTGTALKGIGTEAEGAAGKTANLSSRFGGVASALTGIPPPALAAVAALAVVVGGALILNKVLSDEQKAQINVSDSANTMAKSLGIAAGVAQSAAGSTATAVDKLSQSQTKFAQANAATLSALAGDTGVQQHALITQQLVTLKYEGVSDKDLQKFLSQELAALGPDKKFHVPITWDTTSAKNSYDTLVKDALNSTANFGDNLKFSFSHINDGLTVVGSTAKGKIDSLATSVKDAFSGGDIQKGIGLIQEFTTAAQASGASVKQQQADVNYFIDQVIKGSHISKASLDGITSGLKDAKTPAAEVTVIMKNLATSFSPVIDSGVNLTAVARTYTKALADGKTQAEAMALAVKQLSDAEKAAAAPTQQAIKDAKDLGAAYESVYVAVQDSTKQLSTSLDTIFTDVSKQLTSVGDSTTAYTGQLTTLNNALAAAAAATNTANTAANTALQQSLSAQQQVELGAIANQRKMEGAQLDALRQSGQANAANLGALAATQDAAEKASSAQLTSIVTAQNAAKAQASAASTTQQAAQLTVLSVDQADAALKKQNQNIISYSENLKKVTAAFVAGGQDALTAATAAKNVGAMDPTGGFLANLAGQVTPGGTFTATGQQFAGDLQQNIQLNAKNAATGQGAEAASPVGQGLVQGAIASSPNSTAQQIQDRLGQMGFLLSPDQVIQAAKGTINDTWAQANQAMEDAVTAHPSTAIPDGLKAGLKAGTPGFAQAVTDFLNNGVTQGLQDWERANGLPVTAGPSGSGKPGAFVGASTTGAGGGTGALAPVAGLPSATGTGSTFIPGKTKWADGGLFEYARGGVHHAAHGHGGKAKGKIPKAHKKHLKVYADGGMHDTLPNEAVIEPAHGPTGLVQWAEEAAGPWEAFIPGAPSKKKSSLQIWKQVGQMLGGLDGNQLSAAAFAKGGVHVKKAPKPKKGKAPPRQKGAPTHHRHQPKGLPKFDDGGFMSDDMSFSEGGFMDPDMAMAGGGLVASGSSYAKHTHYHVDSPTIVAGDVSGMMSSLQKSSRRKGLVR